MLLGFFLSDFHESQQKQFTVCKLRHLFRFKSCGFVYGHLYSILCYDYVVFSCGYEKNWNWTSFSNWEKVAAYLERNYCSLLHDNQLLCHPSKKTKILKNISLKGVSDLEKLLINLHLQEEVVNIWILLSHWNSLLVIRTEKLYLMEDKRSGKI